jgi:hypothetical protein
VSAPHWGQRGVKGVPHSLQNFAPSGVLVSQRGQRMEEPSGAAMQAVGASMGWRLTLPPSSTSLRWCIGTPGDSRCQAKSARRPQMLEHEAEDGAMRCDDRHGGR